MGRDHHLFFFARTSPRWLACGGDSGVWLLLFGLCGCPLDRLSVVVGPVDIALSALSLMLSSAVASGSS
jgi:hypothetical protein